MDEQAKLMVIRTDLRIAIIQRFLPSRSQGGVAHFTHQLAERLISRGHTVAVYSLDPAPKDAHYRVIRPTENHWIYSSRLGEIMGFALWISRQDFTRYDIVHAQGDNHLLRTPTPVIRTIHGAALAEAWYARKLFTRLMFLSIYPMELIGVARAAAAVGDSRNSIAYFPWVKDFIYQGVEVSYQAHRAAKSLAPTILFVGHRLNDRKRAGLLIDVFSREVLSAFPSAELWLVCDDTVTRPQVKCFSNLPAEELASLYQSAWVFCLPSSYEGFGRPYAEALACGTPVVATPNVGAMEVLDRGRYGVIVDETRLGSALIELLGDVVRRGEMAKQGWQRAQMFTWDHAVTEYEALYDRVLSRQLARAD